MEAATHHRLAVIRARNKKFSESANLFRRALELDPRNAIILCDFAQLHADRKDYDEAEKLLKKALDADPSNPKILFNLGRIIASQRAERQAEGLRYLKLAVGEAEAYRELARIYRSKGEISRAEFADQKAELAEEQEPPRVLANAPSKNDTAGNNAAAVRSPAPVQTPPEVVERVRQELLETNMREAVVGAQQRPAAPPILLPIVPPVTAPPVTAPPATIPPVEVAAVPVAVPLPDSSVPPPMDPFVTLVRPQESTTPPVRILESPPAAAPTQTVVRTIPGPSQPEPSESGPSESLMAASLSDQKSMPESFEPVQEAKNDFIASNPAAGDPIPIVNKPSGKDSPGKSLPQLQRVNIHTSDTAIASSPPPLRVFSSDVPNQQAVDSPLRVLPCGTKPLEQVAVGNPLRKIPSSDSAVPANDVANLAQVPSSSDKGIKKIPRTDQDTVQEQAASVPQKTEFQPSLRSDEKIANETARTTEKNEVARTIKHLPIRDDRIVQTPIAAQPRRESRMDYRPVPSPAPEKKEPHVARTVSEPSAPSTLTPKSTKPNPNNHHFLSANAPTVLDFGPKVRNQSDTTSPTESAKVAARPLARNDITHNDTPQFVSADPLPVKESKPADASPRVVPLPLVAEVRTEGLRTLQAPPPPQPALRSVLQPEPKLAVADPFPTVVSPPLFAEVKRIEPRTVQQPQSKPEPVVIDPFAVVSVDTQPKFTEVKKSEPQRQQKPEPVVADLTPKTVPLPQFAEAKKAEPPIQPKPAPVVADPFPMVTSSPPQFAEAKKIEPRTQQAPPPMRPEMQPAPPPVVAEARQPESLSKLVTAPEPPVPSPRVAMTDVPKPLPAKEEPAGFASSKKSEAKVAIADDPTTGFARSKK